MELKRNKILFKNVTPYSAKAYNQFISFHGKKFSFSYNAYTLAMLGLLLYCIILNIVQKNITLILVFITLFVLMFLLRIYFPSKRYQETKKKLNKNQSNNVTISFYNYYFTVEEKSFSYFGIYKVFETKDYFYLYLDEENAALLNKNGFKIGTASEFTEFIKKKCFFKYRKS